MRKAKGPKQKVSSFKTLPASIENTFAIEQTKASVGSVNYGGEGSVSRSRRSNLSLTARTKLSNIRGGLSPFEDSAGAISISDAVYLCQKAYWNVPIFKQTIDIMSEFSNSDIHWEGGNKAARDFMTALWNKVGLWNIKDQFFREYYRSGIVPMLRFDSSISKEDARKITQRYGEEESTAAAARVTLPIRYVFLNPMDIRAGANFGFALDSNYYKILNGYEMNRLKNPQTDEEKEFFNSLTKEQKTSIQNGQPPLIKLPADRLHISFYKRQDYEPLAVPMGYCVLDDIDMKMELKKMDRVILRSVESAILLVTMGTEPEKGGINEKALEAMQNIFKSETVGRVLVSDYTTEVDFVIPDLKKVLGPEKYQIVNEDISNGLNNIFWGEQKFANAMIKIQVFVERLSDGRRSFINNFLLPEAKRICKLMGFKDYPRPYFKEVDLQDPIQVAKMITRLGEIGVLTPDETVQTIKTGVFPSKEDSLDNQKQAFDHRQKGLFAPLTGPMPMSFDQQQKIKEQDRQHQAAMKVAQQSGRPSGSKSPQSTKNVKPIGTKASFSVGLLKDAVVASDKLLAQVEIKLKKKHGLKKLNDQQKEAAVALASAVMESESMNDWEGSIDRYLSGPQKINHEMAESIEEIAYSHQMDRLSATLLYHSKLNG